MLMNEFDLEWWKPKLRKLNPKNPDEFVKDKPEINDFLTSKFYWLQVRDEVREQRADYFLNLMMKRHQKGIYKIMPNFELVIK